jgi:hypothetical protein
MIVPRKVAIRFAERFQPVMKILRLMACAAIFGSIVAAAQAGAGAMVAMPDPSAAARLAGEDHAPIVHAQYGDERAGGWNGRPGWYGDPPDSRTGLRNGAEAGTEDGISPTGEGARGPAPTGSTAPNIIMDTTPRQAPAARMDAGNQPRTTLL